MLCFGFAVMVVVRDAEWVVILGLMAAALPGHGSPDPGQELLGLVLGGHRVAVLRSARAPWLGRTLRAFGGGRRRAVARTALLSVLAVLVFGVSSPAATRSWAMGSAVVPDLQDRSCCGSS